MEFKGIKKKGKAAGDDETTDDLLYFAKKTSW